ncbi:HD domain-containing phosphohydrolase [Marinobacterium lutimaris]|uniref:GAF domain-containing protein n=1 Tax=Marinobacterium lutimaris TaxID=568106 RepID=A0A1H5UXX0_9GAMM|nr:HD domain-containing phosphohydrolase [Marinobacterium lutimaris]SEF79945.1 GAF domain-containing protein [Marinobacterium lutimaris]
MRQVNQPSLLSRVDTLTERLSKLHTDLLDHIPHISRLACALYDPDTDLLKTFINCTPEGQAINAYEYPLSASPTLSELARNRTCRVIDHISNDITPGSTHSDWLLQQGYESSFTMPMFSGERLLGFIFVDSTRASRFNSQAQRDLVLFCNLIVMAIDAEFRAVKSLLATAQAAREFAHLRDFETGSHLKRMARLARLIARYVAERHQLSDETIEHIFLFAPLHDIGKIGIPDRILLKPGRHTNEERIIMQQHVEKGVAILHKVLDDYELDHLSDSRLMLNIVAYHHEFMDGSGYPNGLSGEQIPIEARIITAADIFDALTSARPYKAPWSPGDALEELERMARAGKLDADCVDAIRHNFDEACRIITELSD